MNGMPKTPFVWAHGPGSALEALAVLIVGAALVAWVLDLITGRGVFEAIGSAGVLWSVAALVRRVSGPKRAA
jgi:hypothetical protein